MIYNIFQLEGAFRNSKLAWWMLYSGSKLVDEYKGEGSNEDAWNHLIASALPTHPYGTYRLIARTTEGNNKGQREFHFQHKEPDNRSNHSHSLNGLQPQMPNVNPDFFLKMMDKRDAERASWEAEKERQIDRYVREAKEEREKREKAEKDYSDLKQKWMIYELKNELKSEFAANMPKPARKKELSDQEKRLWSAADRVISIAGHSMGIPTAALSGLSSNEEENEAESDEKSDKSGGGISAQDKTLLFAVKSLLAEHFGDLIELDVIKVIASIMPTDEGKELKEGIYAFFPKLS
jgi:hypothetical protein